MPTKPRPKRCVCGCGGMTQGYGKGYLPGHDQILRAAVEEHAGGLQSMRAIVEQHTGKRVRVKR